jgi:integrase
MTSADVIRTADVTLHTIFAAYVEELDDLVMVGKRKPDTSYNAVRAFAPFQAYLDSVGIDAAGITHRDVYKYLAQSPYADGTKRLHCTQLRAAYALAARDDVITKNPLAGKRAGGKFEMPDEPDPDPEKKRLSSETLRKMRDRCQSDTSLILWALLTFTGMRRTEVRLLTWEDITWTDDLRAHITIVGAKVAKRRTIPVHPELYVLLDNFRHGRELQGAVVSPDPPSTLPAKPYTHGRSFDGALQKIVGDTSVGFHHFRKTLASSLVDNDVQESVIDSIFGWAPASVRAKYYVSLKLDKLHRAIRKAYADDPL